MVKSFYDIVASDAVACYGLLNVTVVAGRDHIIYHRGIPLGSKLEQLSEEDAILLYLLTTCPPFFQGLSNEQLHTF